MSPQPALVQLTAMRRALAWALVAGLSVAALAAIGAIVSGDFDETDARVIASSVGFTVFSAMAASGASLRFRDTQSLRALGAVTVAFCAAGFVLLLAALWTDGDDDVWRWFASATLAALACSHASLVSGALRAVDSSAVRALSKTSIGLAGTDACLGILAVSGAVDDVGEGSGQLMAVLLILLLLTTALPPILRRLKRSTVAPVAPTGMPPLAAEVLAAADRIDALNADPGNGARDIARECERLRQLARASG